MQFTKFATNIVVAALFALCAFIPQYAALPTDLIIQNAASLSNTTTNANPWKNPVYDYSQSSFGTVHTAASIPSWDEIVGFAGLLLQVTDETLNRIANENNVTGKVDELRGTFHEVVRIAHGFRADMDKLRAQGMTLEEISTDLDAAFDDVLVYMNETFPPTNQAPSHEERRELVGTLLEQVREALRKFAEEHGMSQDAVGRMLATSAEMEPVILSLTVTVGDLVEQHPVLYDVVVFSITAMLIPESWILRPFLSLLGFGPYGPVKGSAAAWAQRRFWGAAVREGSWFAILQRAGMTTGLTWWGAFRLWLAGALAWLGGVFQWVAYWHSLHS